MSRKLPAFKTDKEAEKFLDQDLSDYISADNFAPFQFEFETQTKVGQSSNLRRTSERGPRRRTPPWNGLRALHSADARSSTPAVKGSRLTEKTFSSLRQVMPQAWAP